MNDENTVETNDTELDSLFEDAITPEPPADDDGTQGAAEADTQPAEKPVQDTAERARQAEGRRIREREQRARQAARDEMSQTLRRLGIENPETGGTIDSVDALEAYEKALSDKRISSGRVNADDVRRIVRETIEGPQKQAASQAPQRELDMIRDVDPGMTDLGAILKSDIGADFRRYVNEGDSFTVAYGKAVRARQARSSGERAAGAAKAAGKGHLASTSQRGEGAVSVPADELRIFRELNPDASDKDIREYYNRYKKKNG
jgi:hypothetical protein